MRAAIYARYSSELQDGANSIARQLAACRRWAAEHGYDVAEVYRDEGISGATMSGRPGLQQLLADLRAGRRPPWEAVLVDDASRLDRGGSLAQLAQAFGARGVQLIPVDSGRDLTDENETLLLHVQSGLSAHYLAELGRRTRAGMAQKAARGLWTGGNCYGFRFVRTESGTRVEIDPVQASAVRSMFSDHARGIAVGQIAKDLNAHGVRSPRGGFWATSAVRAILLNPRYVGEWAWNTSRWKRRPEGLLGETPVRPGARARQRLERPAAEHIAIARPDLAIVERGTWDAVQALFAARAAVGPRKPAVTFDLAGRIFCTCGQAIVRSHRDRGVAYLGCSGRRTKGPAACGNRLSQREEVLRQLVETYVRESVLSLDALREDIAEIRRLLRARARAERRPQDVAGTRKAVTRLEAEVRRLTDAVASGQALEPLLAALSDRQAKLLVARRELAAMESPSPAGAARLITEAEAARIAAEYLTRLDAGEEEARSALRELVEEIVVLPYAGDWSRGWTLEIKTRTPVKASASCASGGSGGALCAIPTERGGIRVRR